MPWLNKLYFGDCFTITREHLRNASVDLIYLDPPFNSQRQYNSIYKDETGRPLPDQIDAFCDMWELDPETERSIRMAPIMMRDQGIADATVQLWQQWMRALRETNPRLLAYLAYMSLRLLDFHRVLKPTGSLYLHCDPTSSHYLKALLDAVFGHANFRNEIIWFYRRWGASTTKRFQRMHDVVLFYSKGDDPFFKTQYIETSSSRAAMDRGYNTNTYRDKDGRKRQIIVEDERAYQRSIAEGRVDPGDFDRVVYRKHRGTPAPDVFEIPIINPNARERLGYATQKPLALLNRIIEASCPPDGVVLDPFCGCATTLEAAHNLGRRWIGIDIAIHAIRRVASVRLKERCGLIEGEDYTIQGVPSTLEGAQLLHEQDPYQFQRWAVAEVEGFVTSKQTADGGIDGRLYFDVPNEPDLQSMVLEVKGGAHVRITDLRALRAVLDDDLALMAGLIIMEPRSPHQTRNFERYMAQAGVLEVLGREYPRMQMLTVPEILDGKRFDTPTVAGVHIPQPVLPGIQRAEA